MKARLPTHKTKRERDDDALISETVYKTITLFSKFIALSLYNRHGFASKRTGEVLQEAFDTMSEYTQRYGSDFAETAADKHLTDLKINITVRGR